jgi:hypothetical protein
VSFNHNTFRCGCGQVCQLPHAKARSYGAKCEVCARAASESVAIPDKWERIARELSAEKRADEARSKWEDLRLPVPEPIRLADPADAIHFTTVYDSGPPAQPATPGNSVVCTGVDVESGVLTFSSGPGKCEQCGCAPGRAAFMRVWKGG